VAEAMAEENVSAVGANCGSGIERFPSICARMRAACRLPLWIKPNAGLPEITPAGIAYSATPAEFAAHVPALLAAGASFIGGCCGTTPEFVRAIAEVMQPCA
jgi:methionine synthase I (cobalamin-dependent)